MDSTDVQRIGGQLTAARNAGDHERAQQLHSILVLGKIQRMLERAAAEGCTLAKWERQVLADMLLAEEAWDYDTVLKKMQQANPHRLRVLGDPVGS